MYLSAVQRLTLLDYPGKTACTAFLAGCNFRCHYCHNSEFVLPEKIREIAEMFIPERAFFRFLEGRKGLLDGVCITGGEPTVQPELTDFIREIKAMGFLVKLDTNGSAPHVLEQLIAEKLVDYVAMDVKAGSEDSYHRFVDVKMPFERIRRSIMLIKDAGIDYEFRTTLVRDFHDDGEFSAILRLIRGAKRYALQNFSGKNGCLNREWDNKEPLQQSELERKKIEAEANVAECLIRT